MAEEQRRKLAGLCRKAGEDAMIGYCVSVNPRLASFRLRVLIPSKYVGPHIIGGIGNPTFFYKHGNPDLAKRLKVPIVYDVVNGHFDDPDYQKMCKLATVITCSSQPMKRDIHYWTGRDAVVIPDPYENAESEPAVVGDRVVWFGHTANIESARPYADLVTICSGHEWSLEKEAASLASAGVVLLTGNNYGASENRPVKAIRAGRFVVAPKDCPKSWRELRDFMWIGDVREGISWAFANREEACRKVQLGQEYVRTRFSPQSIGSQWADVFASTSAAATSMKQAGSASISP